MNVASRTMEGPIEYSKAIDNHFTIKVDAVLQ